MSLALIVAGQSNALGYHKDAAPYVPVANVVIWDQAAGQWTPMVPGQNTGTAANPGAWGPEVGFAIAWERDHPGEVLYVVKVAKGETTLAQRDGPDWSPESRGELFDAVAAQVEASHIGNATVLWAQGETDARNEADASHYGERLDALEAAARDKWEAVNFLVSESAGPYTLDQGPDPVTLAGVEFQGDGVHYTGAGELTLGGAFYDKWAGL